MTQAERDIRRKLRVLEHAKESGNVSLACRFFWDFQGEFFEWKRAFLAKGEEGLFNSRPCLKSPTRKTPPEIEASFFTRIIMVSGFTGAYCHGQKASMVSNGATFRMRYIHPGSQTGFSGRTQSMLGTATLVPAGFFCATWPAGTWRLLALTSCTDKRFHAAALSNRPRVDKVIEQFLRRLFLLRRLL